MPNGGPQTNIDNIPVLPVSAGGTGSDTKSGAVNNLLPSQTGHAGDALTTDGTNLSWSSYIPGSGTVTSVALAAGSTKIGLSGTNPITGSGTITIDVNQANLSIAWSQLTGTPTTLSGYGITDSIANRALSNLASVAINLALLPGVDNSIAIGDATHRWSATHTMGVTLYGATSGNIILTAPATPTPYTLTLPSTAGTNLYVLQTDGSGTTSWVPPVGTLIIGTTVVSGGVSGNMLTEVSGLLQSQAIPTLSSLGGANTTLSNLGTTAINTSLIPGNGSIALGLTTNIWEHLFVYETHWGASAGGFLIFSANPNTTAPQSYSLQWPQLQGGASTFLQNDGSGSLSWVAVGANTALSNLASVAINTALLPQTDNSIALGNSTHRWTDAHMMSVNLYGATSGTITLTAPATPTPYTLTLPPTAGTNLYVLQTDGSGTCSWVAQSGGGGANTALSNLATVAINTSLLPASDLTINAGSGTKRFLTTFTGGVSSTSVAAKNLAGTVLFAGAGTATVTFGTAEPDTSYRITLGWDTNENFWVTGKGTGGFTINSSNSTSVGNVDWNLLR